MRYIFAAGLVLFAGLVARAAEDRPQYITHPVIKELTTDSPVDVCVRNAVSAAGSGTVATVIGPFQDWDPAKGADIAHVYYLAFMNETRASYKVEMTTDDTQGWKAFMYEEGQYHLSHQGYQATRMSTHAYAVKDAEYSSPDSKGVESFTVEYFDCASVLGSGLE